VVLTREPLTALILLTVVYAGITFQQPIMFAVCLDIGGPFAGAMVGAMNTSAQVGAFASSLTFGILVDRYSDYSLPFIPMALLLFVGAAFWIKIDPARQIVESWKTDSLARAPARA
jgi:predicted MFS family arabinose efflux permease